jgi:hypothetical protein
VKHIVLVLSGKGGVGKSTFSSQLAFTLAAQGRSVGLLDVDICGPSIPRMLGALGAKVHQSVDGWSPVWITDSLGVMSIGFMLPGEDDAVIWRGPKKNGLIQQFLGDVEWGELDFLVVDTPPGTSDEHISVVQLLMGGGAGGNLAGAVVVTTPQEVALADVRKELNFCKCVGRRPPPASAAQTLRKAMQPPPLPLPTNFTHPPTHIHARARRPLAEKRTFPCWASLKTCRATCAPAAKRPRRCSRLLARARGAWRGSLACLFWVRCPLTPSSCSPARRGWRL